jgi:hypothetical protein
MEALDNACMQHSGMDQKNFVCLMCTGKETSGCGCRDRKADPEHDQQTQDTNVCILQTEMCVPRFSWMSLCACDLL